MSGGGNLTKLSNTLLFTGYLPEAEQTDGLNQVGAWFQQDLKIATGPYKTNLVEALPAAVRVRLSGNPSLTQFAPGIYKVQLSLSGQNGSATCQLSAQTTDAQNNLTSAVLPNQQSFMFVTRNSRICAVNGTGLITPVRIGECDVECLYSRAANLDGDGTVSTVRTEGVYAIVFVRIVP